jgi:hypothetical protein
MTSGSLIANAVDRAVAGLTDSSLDRSGSAPRFSGYVLTDPNSFDLNRIAEPENLIKVFNYLKCYGGRGAGIDGLTYDQLTGTEIHQAARVVAEVVASKTYTPRCPRKVTISKENGKSRELLLQCLLDRVVSKALQLALGDYWAQYLPGTRCSVWDVWRGIERGIRDTGHTVLAIDDVANCFPTAPIEPIMDLHRNHFENADLLWLIEVILRTRDGYSIITGLEQGMPYSPPAMELLLHHCLGHHAQGDLLGQLHRYVDNLTYLVACPDQGSAILRRAQDRLRTYNMRLKQEDGPPVNLRHESADVLGLCLSWESGRLEFSIPAKAYDKLGEGLRKAHDTDHPQTIARSVVNGWLRACGPALGSKDRRGILRKIEGLSCNSGFRWQRGTWNDLKRTAEASRHRWIEGRLQ